jgi:hypothetical protein
MLESNDIRDGERESRLSLLHRVINDRERPLIEWLSSRVFLVIPEFFISLTRTRRWLFNSGHSTVVFSSVSSLGVDPAKCTLFKPSRYL